MYTTPHTYDKYIIILLLSRLEDSDEDNDGCASQYDAVTCTGRQPCSNVFVFGPNFQLTDSGLTMMIKGFFGSTKFSRNFNAHSIHCHPCLIFHPTISVYTIVTGMRDISGENVLSGVYLLGMFICFVLI